MEQKIHDYFENETMPQDCARQIEAALECVPAPRRSGWIRALAAAAMVVLALTVCFRNEITTAFAEVYDYIVRPQNPEVTDPLGLVGEDIYVSYGLVNGNLDMMILISSNSGPICQVREGRLYFVANGEDMDITDLCSEEEAFVYALVDNTGVIHYFIVGGEPENWGYQLFVYDPEKDSGSCWVCGGGMGHVTKESGWEERPWVQDGREKVGHPW